MTVSDSNNLPISFIWISSVSSSSINRKLEKFDQLYLHAVGVFERLLHSEYFVHGKNIFKKLIFQGSPGIYMADLYLSFWDKCKVALTVKKQLPEVRRE